MPGKIIKVENLYGYIELIPTMVIKKDSVILGGACREFDGEGNLISVSYTENLKLTYEEV